MPIEKVVVWEGLGKEVIRRNLQPGNSRGQQIMKHH